ncbi:MAG: TrkH family potassium uptake protein [Persephonella sp.]|nr:MAG: TrkH family potassium uptake protein [Persephonella sp.]RUM59494.1 MAG: TrkH family potassium uptake protein [Persephonella sp.]
MINLTKLNLRFLLVLKLLLSILFFITSLTLSIPLIYSIFIKDGLFLYYIETIGFIGILYLSVFLLTKFLKVEDKNFPNNREALLVAVSVWFLLPLVIANVYVSTGYIKSIIDGYFEAVSGFTTTGASILTDIEVLPKSLLLLRNLTNWIGGLGFAIFTISFTSISPLVGKSLIKFEAPKVIEESIEIKIKKITIIIFTVYLALSILETILLLFTGLDIYNAINYTFATVATGGFAPKNESVGAFNSFSVELIISVFMILGAINLQLYYIAYREKSLLKIFKDEEVKIYLLIIGISIVISSFILFKNGYYSSIYESIRYSIFQIVSASTTTGFSSTDYSNWHPFVLSLMMLLALIGAVSGSTGGGIKIVRLIFLFKSVIIELKKLAHPKAIYRFKIRDKVIDSETANIMWVFLSLYILTFIFVGLVLVFDGYDIITSFSSSVACITSLGPGLGDVGPTSNFSQFSQLEKLILAFEMILGRLEIIPVIGLTFLR